MNSSPEGNDALSLGPYSPGRYLEPMSDNSSESHGESEPLSISSEYSDYQFPDPRSYPGSEYWYRFDGSKSPQANLCPLPASMSATLSNDSVSRNSEASTRRQLIPRHSHSQMIEHSEVQLETTKTTKALQKTQPYQHKYSTRIAPNISLTRPISGPSREGGTPQSEPATIAYMRPNSLRSPQACDACRRRKVRCVVPAPPRSDAGYLNSEPDPKVCMRCIRMSLKCVWGDARRGRQKNSITPKALQEDPALSDSVPPTEETTQISIGISSTPTSIRSPTGMLPVSLPSPVVNHHSPSFSVAGPEPYAGHDPHLPLPYPYAPVTTHAPVPMQQLQYPQYLSQPMYHTVMRPPQMDGPPTLDDFPFATRSYHTTSPIYAPAPLHSPHYYSTPFHEPSNFDYLQHPSDHTVGSTAGPSGSYPGRTHAVSSNGNPEFRNGMDDGQQGSTHLTSMGLYTPFDGELRGVAMR